MSDEHDVPEPDSLGESPETEQADNPPEESPADTPVDPATAFYEGALSLLTRIADAMEARASMDAASPVSVEGPDATEIPSYLDPDMIAAEVLDIEEVN